MLAKAKSVAVVVLLAMAFLNHGCSKDEETGPRIGFTSASSTAVEGATIGLEFTIPLPEGVAPKISVGGSATERADYTYKVSPDRTKLLIQTFEDATYDDETIEIQLNGFSEGARAGEVTKHIVQIHEASLLIKVNWDNTKVDMNLVLWRIEHTGVSFVKSVSTARTDGEVIFLPASLPDGDYGITYQYYSGTSNNLNFSAKFSSTEGTIDGQKGKASTYNAVYTISNVNNSNTVQIEQVLTKSGYNYHSFTPIVVPSSGS